MAKAKAKAKVVKTEDGNGKSINIVVKNPNRIQLDEAQKVSSKVFKEAIRAGALVRSKLEEHMVEQGLWSEEKDKEAKDLYQKIYDGERQLARGGVTKDGKKFVLKDAKELAMNMRVWRMEQIILLASRRSLDEYTVEGQAENAKFDFLVSECTFDEKGERVFASYEDYRVNQEKPHANAAASELSSLMYAIDPDYENNKAENKFLVKYKFAREDGRLVNKGGDLVDGDNRLMDEDGRYIDDKGKLIDVDGEQIDAEGNPVEQFVEFE